MGSPAQGAQGSAAQPISESVTRLIGAMNADTDLVMVALGAEAAAVAPAVWALAAYVVEPGPDASEGEALRVSLREVLNRGRDAALVVALDHALGGDAPLAAAQVHRMVAAYCAAGDEVWAVAPEGGIGGYPVLLGRQIIELFLRGTFQTASELLSANRVHVLTLAAAGAGTAAVLPG